MMHGIVPGAGAGDEAKVYALLAVIADPITAQKRMDELADAATRANEAAGMAAKKIVEIADQEKSLAERTAIADTRERDLLAEVERIEQQTRFLLSKQAAIEQKEKEIAANLERDRSDLLAQKSALDAREEAFQANALATSEAMRAREKACAEREAAAAQSLKKADALKAEYEKKLSNIRQAVA